MHWKHFCLADAAENHWDSFEISVTSDPYVLALNPHCAVLEDEV
jgi:hypothetical protein